MVTSKKLWSLQKNYVHLKKIKKNTGRALGAKMTDR